MSEILPCPFCGCAKVQFQPGSIPGTEILWCSNCGAQTEFHETREQAIIAWNQRSVPPLPSDKLRGLVRKLLSLKELGAHHEYGGADIVIPWEPIQECVDEAQALLSQEPSLGEVQTENSLSLLMQRNEWRSALLGLCDKETYTPLEAAAYVRIRIGKRASPVTDGGK